MAIIGSTYKKVKTNGLITGDDYDDMLLSKFKSKKLGSTSSDFRNFQRTPDWSKFLKENKPENLLNELVG